MACIEQPDFQLTVKNNKSGALKKMDENFFIVLAVVIAGWLHGGKVMREIREGKRKGAKHHDSVLDYLFDIKED